MEKQYYTPKIEEFREGFEFETTTMSSGGLTIMDLSQPEKPLEIIKDPQSIWDKRIFALNPDILWEDSVSHILALLRNGQVRVKWLDREDIETFGWAFSGRTIDNWYDLVESRTMGLSNYSNRSFKIQHDFRTNQGIVIRGYEYDNFSGDSETLYRGICRNKSELEETLKKVGIL